MSFFVVFCHIVAIFPPLIYYDLIVACLSIQQNSMINMTNIHSPQYCSSADGLLLLEGNMLLFM